MVMECTPLIWEIGRKAGSEGKWVANEEGSESLKKGGREGGREGGRTVSRPPASKYGATTVRTLPPLVEEEEGQSSSTSRGK